MAVPSIPEAEWSALQDEAIEFLQQLVQIHTINRDDVKSGSKIVAVGETVADQLIKKKLWKDGIDADILEAAPTRGNLIARLAGDGSRKPVLLLGHLDVAGVTPEGWTAGDPFGGDIKDGRLFGRGTADMKDLVVMHVMALLIAKRRGLKLKRDLILAGVADEEAGSHKGMLWLIANHWDKIAAEFSFNEGFSGSPMLSLRDRKTVIWVGLEAIEKRILAACVTAHGHAGHASSEQPDNCIYRLAAALERLSRHPRPMVLNPVSERLVRTIEAYFGEDLRESISPDVRAIFHDVVVPTKLNAGTDLIVLPGEATAALTCRLLPTTDTGEFQTWLETVVGLPGVRVTYPYPMPPPSPAPSSAENNLVTAYKSAVRRHFGERVPVILTQGIGTTDSFHLRERGVAAYGVRPLVDAEPEGIHANNESIPVDGFKAGLRMFVEVVLDLAT